MAFLDDNGLTTVWERMKTYVSNIVSNYVKKEDGKGLSSNDYTTTEKNKLSNIEEGAQKNQNAFSAFTFIRSEENGGNIKFSANSPSTELPWTLSPIFSIGSSYGGPMLSLKEATEENMGVVSKNAMWTYVKEKSDDIYAKKSDMSTVYKYKGSVTSASNLPTSGMSVGDTYNIEATSTYGPAGTNVSWTGSEWDPLGGMFEVPAMTTTEINNICTLT